MTLNSWIKLGEGDKLGVILTDHSIAFDAVNHSLLLAKIDAYGLSRTTLKLMQNFLCKRCQRNSTIGSLTEVTTGVPQGSNLGLLLFYWVYYVHFEMQSL